VNSRPLTRLFLQRFIENDLIAPDADHVQVLSTTAAAVVSSGAFVSVLISVKYLLQVFPSPDATAAMALDDHFLYCAWSMLIMAIVALVEWDSLGFDARDSAILGVLPVSRAAFVRAKLAAVAVFVAVFLAALIAIPAIIHPLLMVAKLPVGLKTAAILVVAHILTSLASGLFGFSTMLAIREAVYAALGAEMFRSVSRVLQVSLLAACASMLLLMPFSSSRVIVRMVHDGPGTSLMVPDWFVALHETIDGYVLDSLPKPDLPPASAADERAATQQYQAAIPVFKALGRQALAGLLITCAVAIAGLAWNTRRFAVPAAHRPGHAGRISRSLHVLLAPKNAVATAGFLLATRTLARSPAHRVALVAAAAVAMSASVVTLHAAQPRSQVPSEWLLAMQPLALAVLLLGFRHTVTLPAALHAGWCVLMAWNGKAPEFFTGVRRAALVWIVLPTTLVFIPVHVGFVGWRAAAWLAATGIMAGSVLLTALLLGHRTLPFVAEHIPSDNLNTRVPFYILGIMVGAYLFGIAQQTAFGTPSGPAVVLLALGMLIVGLRVADSRRRAKWAGLELLEVEGSGAFVE
jgi:hypothetical protein